MKEFSKKGNLVVHLGRSNFFRKAVLEVALAGILISTFNTSALSLGANALEKQSVIHVTSAFAHDTASVVKKVNELASQKGAGGTCFGAQMDNRLVDADTQIKVEKSSVYIKAETKDHRFIEAGTGTLIRNSGGRILTAFHVGGVNQNYANTLSFKAYNSKGQYLGDLTQVNYGADNEEVSHGRTFDGKLDMSVLDVTPTTEEAKLLLADIPGLDLAPIQRSNEDNPEDKNYNGTITGIFGTTDTVGVDHGHSGSALVDRQGLVHGVTATGSNWVTSDFSNHISIDVARMTSLVDGEAPTLTKTYRATENTFVSVADTGILEALGEAGKGIKTSFEVMNSQDQSSYFVAGYSKLGCIVSEGHIRVTNVYEKTTKLYDGLNSTSEDFYDSIAQKVRAEYKDNPEDLLDGARSGNYNRVQDALDELDKANTAILEASKFSLPKTNTSLPPADMMQTSSPPKGAWFEATKNIWQTNGHYGNYRINTSNPKITLEFQDGENYQEIGHLKNNNIVALIDKANAIIEKHAETLQLTQEQDLSPVSFYATEHNGQITILRKTGGVVDFPVDLGPAVTIIGGTEKNIYFHQGIRLGQDANLALKKLASLTLDDTSHQSRDLKL